MAKLTMRLIVYLALAFASAVHTVNAQRPNVLFIAADDLRCDLGFQLGDHTLWCKTSNFELDARVPLIVAPPAGAQVERTSAIVELLDLYPTITEMCGFEIPPGQEGVSLKPLIDGTQSSVKLAALTQHPRPAYHGETMDAMGHSIRTQRFRYTEWRSRTDDSLIGSELYDHDLDPAESVNRVEDPAYASHLPLLRSTLANLAGGKSKNP